VGDPGPDDAADADAFFMKNLAMLGGALLTAYFGAGPVSLDELVRRPLPEATPARAAA
jgi:uncharacterized membrane protein YphA (DoxX/SURF4 family)